MDAAQQKELEFQQNNLREAVLRTTLMTMYLECR
jgi:hypothetical protein